MKGTFTKFLGFLIVFGLVLFFGGLGLLKTISTASYTQLLAFLVVFFTFVTALVHYSLIRVDKANHKKFVNVFLLITALKLFIYLIIVSTFAFFNKQDAAAFVILFFSLYLCYTIFELLHLFRFLKPKKIDS